MILLVCNQNFLHEQLYHLLKQKEVEVTQDPNKNYFVKILFSQHNQNIILDINKAQKVFKAPLSFKSLINYLFDELFLIQIDVKDFTYYPYKQALKFQNKNIQLKQIHYQIINNLILNLNTGLEKDELYKKIWPNDKSLSINKLDTHLTNLKSLINNDLGSEVDFQTKNRVLKLIIN